MGQVSRTIWTSRNAPNVSFTSALCVRFGTGSAKRKNFCRGAGSVRVSVQIRESNRFDLICVRNKILAPYFSHSWVRHESLRHDTNGRIVKTKNVQFGMRWNARWGFSTVYKSMPA